VTPASDDVLTGLAVFNSGGRICVAEYVPYLLREERPQRATSVFRFI
jgi:hypothetical protein